jgi:hypothetical protein
MSHFPTHFTQDWGETVSDFPNLQQAIYVSAIFYNTTLGFIKLSVLSLYHRILRGVQSQLLRNIVWSIFILVAANTIANVLVSVFQCWPIQAAWDVSIPPGAKR